MSMSIILAVSLALPQAEFAKYYEAITGRALADGVLSLAVDPAVSKTGKDAYTIMSEGPGAKITGSNLRSVFYGVYDLLERRGGCHWFWDGDVVPKKAAIDLSGLDVREEAQFEWRGLRYFAHRGLTRFQAEHWGLEDWKKEIDWCLKRRLNVFMLRIGQDDLFHRTFPDIVANPDPSKDLPGHGRGYDNRTLFWSNEYRGKLRHDLQHYAFDRGLEVPEDFGTMTHWYSRTPEDFLEKVNPPFLPQATSGYKERNGLVWDIRDDKWVDMYWKMTKTAVDAYGKPGPGLLHTIGLGERLCYTNRADNLKLKLLALDKFLKRAHRDYPERKVLLAGWDFYFTWYPEEVQALVKTLDPKRDIIWDYEGDATRDYRPEMMGQQNNFTKWGVMGKFPYTYSIFLAFEDALDMRANYPLIEERQKLVQNDEFCAGYILWPESSHTDTLCLQGRRLVGRRAGRVLRQPLRRGRREVEEDMGPRRADVVSRRLGRHLRPQGRVPLYRRRQETLQRREVLGEPPRAGAARRSSARDARSCRARLAQDAVHRTRRHRPRAHGWRQDGGRRARRHDARVPPLVAQRRAGFGGAAQDARLRRDGRAHGGHPGAPHGLLARRVVRPPERDRARHEPELPECADRERDMRLLRVAPVRGRRILVQAVDKRVRRHDSGQGEVRRPLADLDQGRKLRGIP